jgi:peptidoglycan-N-acetylglucosamine deacetylase
VNIPLRRYVVAILALLAVCGAFWFNAHRTLPLADAVNPAYWVRRWRGEDLYDARHRILFHGNHKLPEIALTFDDGPRAPVTGQLLDVLHGLGVRATFFVVGARAIESPALVRRMYAEGHEVGNHSQNHQRLDTLSPERAREEVNDCDVSVFLAADRHLRIMRPPGVRYNDSVLRTVNDLGYVMASWTVGAHDYEDVSASFIVDHVTRRAENGSIVLLHSDRPATLEAIPRIVRDLKARGFRFVTVSEMLAHLPKPVSVESNLPSGGMAGVITGIPR